MFTNKHVVVAMLVAPILAIMAWFAVDHFIGERPHAAMEGTAYTLVAKSSCRYASGQCELENAEFRLSIRPQARNATSISLVMSASHALDSALMGMSGDESPQQMTSIGDDTGTEWLAILPLPRDADETLRIAVTARGATWFAEVPTIFLEGAEVPSLSGDAVPQS